MRTWTASALDALVIDRIPEAGSLEYKRDLHLDGEKQRSEVAKDLTAMGNAGGGSVLFGVDEDTNDWPVATSIEALTDPALLSKLENILQDGVRPPLVATFTPVEVPAGFVLVAEVEPSPLGPYMVELYGERRFHIRDGIRTRRMTEAEVSQAYALAARNQNQRDETWARHSLPITPPGGALWLSIAGLPAEPLTDLVDLAAIEPADLKPPTEPTAYLNHWSLADMSELFRSMTRWADGFHAEAVTGRNGQLGRQVRVHRTGAAGIALQIEEDGEEQGPVSLVRVSRIFNGALIYLGWLWDHLGVRRPIELKIRVRRCDVIPFQVDNHAPGTFVKPPGVTVDAVELEHVLSVNELQRSGRRHRLGERFADRVAQAFGHRQVQYPFRWGELYGQDGTPLGLSAGESEIYAGSNPVAAIHTGGLVVAHSTGQPVGTFAGGVLADDEGHVLGVLELAPGSACPDDFVASGLQQDPTGMASRSGNHPREPFTLPVQMPAATSVWSARDALVHTRGH